MSNVLKKAAEILVECGHCSDYGEALRFPVNWFWYNPFEDTDDEPMWNHNSIDIDPFADTLEGRRQADAIEDWLILEDYLLWIEGCIEMESLVKNHREDRLNRIKWCLEQLSGE